MVWEFHKQLICNIYRSGKISFLNKLTGKIINARYQHITKNSQKCLCLTDSFSFSYSFGIKFYTFDEGHLWWIFWAITKPLRKMYIPIFYLSLLLEEENIKTVAIYRTTIFTWEQSLLEAACAIKIKIFLSVKWSHDRIFAAPFCWSCFFLRRQGTADAGSPIKGRADEVGTAT